MGDCCNQGCSLNGLQERQRSTLRIVLAINALMFFVVITAALYAQSSALLSDSMDYFGDAVTYALSLFAISRSVIFKARVALFKGVLIFSAAALIAGQIIYKLWVPSVPVFEVMGIFSLVGLLANSTCLFLLWRHRNEDINMSSVWECSRNDIVVNLSVLLAAGGVWLSGDGWPDIIIATLLVVFLIRSALRIITSARAELERPITPQS
ncbi:MAG: cation transporter [Gammaproteobacteria bacterium]|nr:cation transporter [Gammaproteobacteria bacterium]